MNNTKSQDIVERLRFYGRYAAESQEQCGVRKNEEREEGAVEIERLRGEKITHISIVPWELAQGKLGISTKTEAGYHKAWEAELRGDIERLLQGWQPIEVYDALKKDERPALAVFRFAPTEPRPHRPDFLEEAFKTERHMGRRECTSFLALTLPEGT